MKAWDDIPLRPIPPRAEPPVSIAPGRVRIDLTVVVPDAAVAGDANFVFAVLSDPETGDWYGEDPDNPGSAMIPVDRDHALPMTPAAVDVLDQVAAVGRSTLDRLVAGADATFEGWFREEARRLASTLGRPMLEEIVIDLLRARRGSVPPPARWWRTKQGVRLQTVRGNDDPLGWIEDWPSTEQFLVPDGEPSRRAARRLADVVRARGSSPAKGVIAEVRRAAVERLAELAPDLLAYVSERNTEQRFPAPFDDMNSDLRVRFGGYLDRCGRPVVGRWTHRRLGTYDVCEGCRYSDEFGPPLTFEATTSDRTNGNGYWVACECACGHIAGARIEDMDRTGRHLRCPACLLATHPAEERAPGSFLDDPRVGRRGT